jgi:D-sedoheptulose 7-phosphate isomerase
VSTFDFARNEIARTIGVLNSMLVDEALLATLQRVADRCTAAIRAGNKVMFCGNGGSAADSQHLAAELIGKLLHMRPAMAGLALTTDSSALTAIGNDFGYQYVFSRQIEGLGRSGDVLVGISTSGRSHNVVSAFETARARSITTVAMTGAQRGPIADLADEWIAIPHQDTAKIQEGHIVLGHIFCAMVESQAHPKAG